MYLGKSLMTELLEAKAVFGLFPAVSDGDDVKVFSDETKRKLKPVFRFLRNQEPKEKGVPNLSLADYIAPETSGLTDTYRSICCYC